MAAQQLTSSLDLFRRLPSQNVAKNLELISPLIISEDVLDELLNSIDSNLLVKLDLINGREFLACDYNRDGDSYRSPWSNTYLPELLDGTQPSTKIRSLEINMNEAFDIYRELYYETGSISSAYLWDLGEEHENNFAGVVLFKKSNNTSTTNSSWDSIHVFETILSSSSSSTSSSSSSSINGRSATYKLTSTILLYMSSTVAGASSAGGGKEVVEAGKESGSGSLEGEVNLGGSMTRQNEATLPHDPSTPLSSSSSHIKNLGTLIEQMELKMRSSLSEVYFSKTKEIVNTLRTPTGYGEETKRNLLQGELVGLLRRGGANKTTGATVGTA